MEMMGVPNYKNPAFWKYGWQTLRATGVIATAIVTRNPIAAARIPTALMAVESQVETKVIPESNPSGSITRTRRSTLIHPTKSWKSSRYTPGVYAYHQIQSLLIPESLIEYYESNR